MIEKVRKAVIKEAMDWDWKFHISLVVKYAKHLAKIEKVNEKITELAALLHDIGRLKFGEKNHEITGVLEAEKILKKLNYSEEVIEEVKHCIKTHRGKKDYTPKTKIAEIVRDANAISHFDVIPVMIQHGLKRYNEDIEKTVKWVHKTIDRDWNRIHLPTSKKLVEEKYKSIKLLLEATEDAFKSNK